MTIDTHQLISTISLPDLITADLGKPNRSGNWQCPFHQDKTPSFGIVKADPTRWHCFGCGATGDAIEYLQRRRGLGFREACESLSNGRDLPTMPGTAIIAPQAPRLRQAVKPSDTWAAMAAGVCRQAERRLWSESGKPGRDYLKSRGITAESARRWRLGWQSVNKYFKPAEWGLEPDHKQVWMPAGLVFPWRIGGDVWRVNVRRMEGKPKYTGPAGLKPGLYGADRIKAGKPAILVEGEIDAITIDQYAGDLITAVATGSTGGARVARWVFRLRTASVVLLAFDREQAGDDGAAWWLDQLPLAKRWLPLGKDAADMGAAVRPWVAAGLGVDAPPTETATGGKPEPFSDEWLEAFTDEQLERLAIRTVAGMTDADALKAGGLTL